MWHLGTWIGGGGRLGSASLIVGLDDLKGLFQTEQFYDTMEMLRYSSSLNNFILNIKWNRVFLKASSDLIKSGLEY